MSFSYSMVEIDFDTAIEYALKNSTIIKMAIKDKEISNARAIEAQSNALPSLNSIISRKRNLNIATQDILFDNSPISVKFGQENQVSYGLSFKQTIFESRVFSAIRASNIYDEMTHFAYEIKVLSIKEKTHIAFYKTLLTKELKKVLEASLNRAKSNLNKTILLYSLGKASELDRIRSESIVSNLESDIILADKDYKISLASFKRIIGYPLSESILLVGNFNNKELIEFNFESLIDKMLNFQPSLNYARKNIELMKENISAVRSELMPNLYLFGSYNFYNNFDDGNYHSDNFTNDQIVGINFNIPIFNGFGSRSRLKIAKAEHSKYEYKKSDLINDFYLELENVIMNIQSLAEKINADLKIIELAKQERSVASSLIENGMISQIEMENAELNLLESELLLLQSKLQYQISLAALYRLIGGKEILYEN